MKKLATLVALAALSAGCTATDNANTNAGARNGNAAIVVPNNANNANAANANAANANANASNANANASNANTKAGGAAHNANANH
ncbi:MAG TPA: hypothetical protein VGB76_00455 [Pyrinomonadaceae bacterium]|jgi:hypothetical protein